MDQNLLLITSVDHLLVQVEVETVVALVKLDQMQLQPLVVVAEDADQTLNQIQTEEASGGSGVVVVRYKIGSTSSQKATGGAVSFYGGKTIHTFMNSGTFATTSNWSAATVEYVVVGGGGAGGDGGSPGSDAHGGGGAGSYRTGTTPIGAHTVSTTIQVGAGAAAVGYPAGTGTSSYFGTPITSPGGGSGGHLLVVLMVVQVVVDLLLTDHIQEELVLEIHSLEQ